MEKTENKQKMKSTREAQLYLRCTNSRLANKEKDYGKERYAAKGKI